MTSLLEGIYVNIGFVRVLVFSFIMTGGLCLFLELKGLPMVFVLKKMW